MIKLQKQVKELSHRLAKMKKRKLENHDKCDHGFMARLENPFKSQIRGNNL
jgi:hypothetical protein